MFVAQAPRFDASGDRDLAANYVINFRTDKNWRIPTNGEWQGSAKRAISLYVDNYDNNTTISINVGQRAIKVPAYTAVTVTVASVDDVDLSCETSDSVRAYLYTELRPEGSVMRGNAPASSNALPFTVAGSINMGSSNIILDMAFNTQLGLLYACTNKMLIMVETKNNYVINAKPLPADPASNSITGSPKLCYLGDGRMAVVGNFAGSIYVTILGTDYVFSPWTYISMSYTTALLSVCYKENSKRIAISCNGNPGIFLFNPANFTYTKVNGAETYDALCYHPNGFVYGASYNSTGTNGYKISKISDSTVMWTISPGVIDRPTDAKYVVDRDGIGYIAVVGSASSGSIYLCVYDDAGKVIYTTTPRNSSASEVITAKFDYNPQTNLIYTINPGSPSVGVVDMLLRSKIADMQTAYNISSAGICYSPVANNMYFVNNTSGSTIQYGK